MRNKFHANSLLWGYPPVHHCALFFMFAAIVQKIIKSAMFAFDVLTLNIKFTVVMSEFRQIFNLMFMEDCK